MDSPSLDGVSRQHGQALGGCAPAEPGEESWAGDGFSAPASPETLGPEDPRE